MPGCRTIRWVFVFWWSSTFGIANGIFFDLAAADEAPPPLFVRGIVLDAEKRPLAEADVSIREWIGHWEPILQAKKTGKDGRFELIVPREAYYGILATARGLATWQESIEVSRENQEEHSIVLQKPANTWIDVRSISGEPLSGARIAVMEIRSLKNGSMYVTRDHTEVVGWTLEPSDENGRLNLPPISEDATVDVWIEHPRWAMSKLTNLRVADGRLGSAILDEGSPTTFELAPSPDLGVALDGRSCEVRLRSGKAGDSANIPGLPFSIEDGKLTIPLHPGSYSDLQLKIKDCVVTPVLERQEALVAKSGSAQTRRFLVRPQVSVKGRVLDRDGQPIAGANLIAEVENRSPDPDVVPTDAWRGVEWVETNEQGEFECPAAPGRCRLSVDVEGWIPEQDRYEVEVASGADNRVPDIVMSRLPTLRGRVLGGDGQPFPNAVVRMRSRSLHWMHPVVTDEQGRFEFKIESLSTDPVTKKREFEHWIVAFDPQRALAGRKKVDLRAAGPQDHWDIALEATPPDWTLTQFSELLSPWERADEEVLRIRKPVELGQRGKPAPEIDSSHWLNTDARSLSDFRGKYVLLDFWFIGCGPCHYDLPSVKLVHRFYADRGVAVVAVHTNSSTVEEVRAYADREGMTFPIVVDEPDGRITEAYRKVGLNGYPSYMLIDPDGNFVQNDSAIPSPTLRNYKLEIVRRSVLERDQ